METFPLSIFAYTSTPWIKVTSNCRHIHGKQPLADPNSVVVYYQRLIQLRKEHPVFVYGTYDLLLDDHQEIYAFTRTSENVRLLVILNVSANTPVFTLPGQISFTKKILLIGNYASDPVADIRQLTLRPSEACVYLLR